MFNVTYDTWKLWFNDAKHTLGIHDPKLTTCTRHTCATRLAEGNMSLAVIMTYGGWTSPSLCVATCTFKPMLCWAVLRCLRADEDCSL